MSGYRGMNNDDYSYRDVNRGNYRDKHRETGGSRHSYEREGYKIDRMSKTNDYRDRDRDRDRDRNSRDNMPVKRLKVSLKPSGILTKYINTNQLDSEGNKIILENKSKYSPPDDSFIPDSSCKIHLFKYNEETKKQTEVPLINYKSFFILGRDNSSADIIISPQEDGDLISKQHAVLQFRKFSNNEVKLYLLDLKSTNGTFLNNEKTELPTNRFIELKNKDTFRLGDYNSILEFILITDN